MIACSDVIEAWTVKYTYHGLATKMICLDKVKADAYAVQYGGIIHPMYCALEVQPSKTPVDDAPWEGETNLGAL